MHFHIDSQDQQTSMRVNTVSSMMEQLANVDREKPVIKFSDLIIGEKYSIIRIFRSENGFKSLMMETSDFLVYLPNRYKAITVCSDDLRGSFAFSVESFFTSKQGQDTPKLSFYQNGKKL